MRSLHPLNAGWKRSEILDVSILLFWTLFVLSVRMSSSSGGPRLENNSFVFDGKSILVDDIVGCTFDERASCLNLVAYPLRKDIRTREIYFVPCDSADIATSLGNAIRRPVPPHLTKDQPNNKVLVINNPFSGQKRAVRLWQEFGRVVMEDARIRTDVVETDYPLHATKIVKELDIDQYDAILVNSGDGLVTEVLCGLLMRADRERSLKIPLCHIPGGTSNALAASILFACNEPFSTRDVFITECALMAARPRYRPLQLFTVDTQNNGRKSMFMSANYGLVADIDLGSERFRWAGLARLHIEAIIRILQLPRVARYPTKISYIPVEDPETSRKTRITHYNSRHDFGENHFAFPPIEQAIGKEWVLEKDFDSIDEALNSQVVDIPPLGQDLDKRWKTIEGEYVFVNVTALSHLGSDVPYLPSATLGSDILYLTLIDWKTVKTRFHVADLFIRMNRGVHLGYECLQIIPVKAVRVEPLSPNGYFAIDGEPCANGSAFQVAPSSHQAVVVSRNEVQ